MEHSDSDNPRDIAAIETRYNHHRYRSRLEARWAVFFDSIGLQFEYEPEGLELPDGTRYLPDFYLPQVKWFAEVKPNLHIFYAEDKARLFVKYGGLPVLMLDGPPSFKGYSGLEEFEGSILDEPYSLDVIDHAKTFAEGRLWSDLSLCVDIPAEANFSRRYIEAVELALSARFE